MGDFAFRFFLPVVFPPPKREPSKPPLPPMAVPESFALAFGELDESTSTNPELVPAAGVTGSAVGVIGKSAAFVRPTPRPWSPRSVSCLRKLF